MVQINSLIHPNVFLYSTKDITAEEVPSMIVDLAISSSTEYAAELTLQEPAEKCDICVSQRTTYFQTLFHLLKCHLGSGMFAVGDFFHSHSSILLGPVLTICLGIVCILDNHILATCSKEIKQQRDLQTYPSLPDTMGYAFESGPQQFRKFSCFIRVVVKGLNLLTQLGCCIVYFIFISSSLQSLLQMLARHGIVMDEHLMIVILLFPLVLTIFMSHLRFLTLFSVFASILVFFTVSLTLYVSSSDLPPAIPRPTIAHWSQIPLFFGTSIYCFEGITKTLPLHNEMVLPTHPVRHLSLLIVILAAVGSLFVIIALICFIKFVDELAGDHFAENLVFGLTQNYLCSEIAHLTIALCLLFSYTLQFHIALMLVWPELISEHGPTKHKVLAELAVRLLLAMSTFAAVEVMPRLGMCVSLTGAVSGTLLALLLPPLCDLALHWNTNSRPWKHSFDFLSIFLAIIGTIAGMFYSFLIIIKEFPEDIVLRS